ncbi:hypothetical protein PTKIN_Ptkin15bG0081600 [Pterospermum kingtungense]
MDRPFLIIPYISSSNCTLHFQLSDSNQPPLTNPPHAITVKTTMLPLGKAHYDHLPHLFSKPGPHIFNDTTLPISFVALHITEFLKSVVLLGKVNLVSTPIDHGGDVNTKDSKGRSLISLAVEARNFDVVNVLISCSCEINNSVDHLLHYVTVINRVDLMRVLFRAYKSVDLNSINFCARTPIHIAASCGHIEVIRFCLSVGGNPEVLDTNRCTPLHLAAQEGHLDVVEYLLEASSYDKYALNKQGKTAFALSIENGHSTLYNLLHLGDALNLATRTVNVNGIKSCVAEGANMNGKDQNGWTPLLRAAFKGGMESVKVLLNQGAEVNVVDDNGYTLLHCAVEAGHVEVLCC